MRRITYGEEVALLAGAAFLIVLGSSIWQQKPLLPTLAIAWATATGVACWGVLLRALAAYRAQPPASRPSLRRALRAWRHR